MDEFFTGSPNSVTKILSTTTAAYTVSFLDKFEKFANWVKVANCTVTNRGQLLILNQKGNSGNNTGVRYINSLPNSSPRFTQSAPVYPGGLEMGFGASGLLADPAFSL
jgi:hypothetical protein